MPKLNSITETFLPNTDQDGEHLKEGDRVEYRRFVPVVGTGYTPFFVRTTIRCFSAGT